MHSPTRDFILPFCRCKRSSSTIPGVRVLHMLVVLVLPSLLWYACSGVEDIAVSCGRE